MESEVGNYTRRLCVQNDEEFLLENDILRGPETFVDLENTNIGEALLNAFDENPDPVSQIDAATGEKTTNAEMRDRSIRCALWMENEGFGGDDVVTLFTHNQLDAYVPVLATYFVQAVMNPWRHDLTLDQALDWLELYEPKLMFVRVDGVKLIEEALLLSNKSTKIVVFGEHPRHLSLNDIMQSQSSSDVENYRPSKRKNPREVATIINSSGTTGRPKGVMISAEAMLRNALDCKLEFRGKNVLWYAAPNGIMWNSLVLMCIFHKATRIISNSTEPREMCKVIEEFEVNYTQMNAVVLNPLARFEELYKYNLDCLEVVRIISTKLNRVTFNKLKSSCLRNKIYQGYGSTEIGTTRLYRKFGQTLKNHNSIGIVSPNLQLKIIDRLTKKTLGANAPGEILIKTPTIMLGYYKNPEATSKALDPEGWYHTKDLGYYDETGEVFFIGRITDVFEYCGEEFFTNDIEDVLWEHPAVENLSVVPVIRESVGQVPVAFVVIRPGENMTQDEMIELLKNSERYKTVPLKVQFIDKMPLTPSLKIAKGHLTKLALKSTNHYTTKKIS